MKGMRATIATRMHSSLQEMAQLTLTLDADMDAVVANRNARKAAAAGATDAVVPGFTDYVIAAAAKALRRHPHVNSQITAEGVAYLPQINVGMAVALEGGLVVPVVHDTPSLSLEQLSAQTTRLATAARNGSLKLPDLEGGTFSVTALGMFGVDAFTPVINPPNTAILGVGRIRTDVAWVNGAAAGVQRLTLSLTWDHRAFDGAPAAEFARSVAELLADPASL
jgi:pyruvate dehydrogenase E2 component (dihydrolipoamide acetyltransferase)